MDKYEIDETAGIMADSSSKYSLARALVVSSEKVKELERKVGILEARLTDLGAPIDIPEEVAKEEEGDPEVLFLGVYEGGAVIEMEGDNIEEVVANWNRINYSATLTNRSFVELCPAIAITHGEEGDNVKAGERIVWRMHDDMVSHISALKSKIERLLKNYGDYEIFPKPEAMR